VGGAYDYDGPNKGGYYNFLKCAWTKKNGKAQTETAGRYRE
jgi:hypothetical protein